ncbi:hypothetical protein [Marinobacter sp. SS13-12]|uniref:hypothetical protein n=1 Tax=Marinobacter sp. SS13-12 TaxID=3050451 RepID=UPI0025545898|nr:hypothetical protein [Marinobacter sp. SS13-12]MDK8465630.1 hypothetical protein [Marinobacter sp. SS13-12]
MTMSFNNDMRSKKHLSGLLLCVLTLLASGLAGAHGAPEAENIPSQRLTASIERTPRINGFTAMIIDAPRPAILVTYRGEETAMIQGTEGEPFLRFTSQQVMANTHSASWHKLADNQPGEGRDHDIAPGETNWVEVSGSGSYAWLDPRLNGELLQHAGDRTGAAWSIPVVSASAGTTAVAGRITSIPVR